MRSVVATRYARALVDVVSSHTPALDAAQVVAQLHSVRDLINGSAELRAALASPAVAPSRKRAVMRRLLEPMGLIPQVRNFIYVVIDHRRIEEFESILEEFETLLDEHLGFVRASVESARELDAAQKQRLEALVSKIAGRKARVRFTTEPALIGGVVAHVGSKVYDGSVRGELDRLRTRLVYGA
jgi:F-type H+-transporting ATPase subunit delta